MASYTVRIVLHDSTWDDYNKLYKAMSKEGFSDEIDSDDGIKYKMPDGEYTISASLTHDDIFKKAKKAATTTGKQYAVFSTQSSGRKWSGLRKI